MGNNKENGFEVASPCHIKKHYDKKLKKTVVTISPGGLYITNKDEVISTVLGSCISVCVWDAAHGIGGMNHFMIPGSDYEIGKSLPEDLFRFGSYSMDYMLKQFDSMGANKNLLELKVFGGGAIISSSCDVGSANIQFIQEYIDSHQLSMANQDLGGELPRKVNYFVETGKAYVKGLRALHKCVVAHREKYKIQ